MTSGVVNPGRLSCPRLLQGLNNAVALDFHYAEQMIYWTDVTTQGSMIRRMRMNGSNVEVSETPGTGDGKSMPYPPSGHLGSGRGNRMRV